MNISSEGIKVAIRIRPPLKTEIISENTIYTDKEDDRKIKIIKNGNCFEGFFDRVFSNRSSQNDVYEFIKNSITDISEGINSTIFTYGQTGSGKTYTMFGSDWTINETKETNIQEKRNNDKDLFIKENKFLINPFSDSNGIIPRIISQVFLDINNKKNTIICSFLQIYNEGIYDLLEDNFQRSHQKEFCTYTNNNVYQHKLDEKSLYIREDKLNGIYVDGLSEYIVENAYDCLNLLKKGERNRKKRQTSKNEMSSRSHTIFMLSFQSDKLNNNGTLKKAKLHLCDLAGSEKINKGDNHKSIHFSEMININLSLSTLGKVIHSLSMNHNHIAYRDSKLTRLLQDSLGGNTRTYLIANISPSTADYDETFSTLRFADRAKSVFVKVRPNEIVAYDSDLVNKLTKEINSLKELLAMRKKRGTLGEIEKQFTLLKEENDKLKKFMISNITDENIEKLILENKTLKIELQNLKLKITESSQGDLDTNNSNNFSNTIVESNRKNINLKSNFNLESKNLSSVRNEFVNVGADIIYKKNSFNKFYNKNSVMDIKELKDANNRLKILEDLEKRNGIRLKMEIEKIHQEKMKKKEELFNKNIERKKDLERIDGHIRRLNYLYKHNHKMKSKYLIESKDKEATERGVAYNIINHK